MRSFIRSEGKYLIISEKSAVQNSVSVQLKFVCHCLACFVENISNILICGLSP